MSSFKIIFIISIALTAVTIFTGGIENGAGNTVLTVLVLVLLMFVNAGYGGGFSNVPTLLSDHYGMSNISAIHGITLSAWAFAGLSGNQLANWIVNKFGEFIDMEKWVNEGVKVVNAGGTNMAYGVDVNTTLGKSVLNINGAEIIYDINELSTDLSGHGGGDNQMMTEMFMAMDSKEKTNSNIANSIESHIQAFAAEYSRTHQGLNISIEEFEEICKK